MSTTFDTFNPSTQNLPCIHPDGLVFSVNYEFTAFNCDLARWLPLDEVAGGTRQMTPQITQAADKHMESELDRLTYFAYLLTLDPGMAFSVVMRAIDGSLEEITAGPDLLERTVELAIEQLRRESKTEWDGESSAFDAVFYGHSAAINSATFRSLKDLSGNPILLLDSTSRITFVLHHVLGYKLAEAAAMAQMDETEYRSQLRRAYLQLASFHWERQLSGGRFLEEPALA